MEERESFASYVSTLCLFGSMVLSLVHIVPEGTIEVLVGSNASNLETISADVSFYSGEYVSLFGSSNQLVYRLQSQQDFVLAFETAKE